MYPFLPYSQFPFLEQGIEPGYLLFDSPQLTMVHQLLGGQAEPQIE
jgi:hypothetical protein